jgi:DNA polymerase-3 subunit delta'
MMSDLLVHDTTQAQIEGVLAKPPHSILIIGPAGGGKGHLASFIASRLLDVTLNKINDQPHFISLQKPDGKQEIPIDDVRQMILKLALKTSGHKRVVVIYGAEQLSEEAQNALLKSIEEPPQYTHFILTAPTISSILPTIASRSQKITVRPAPLEQSVNYFKDHDKNQISSSWNLSRGGAGLMSALLENDNSHPLKLAVEQAKDFMKMDKYQRTIFLDKLSSDKNSYEVFLDALDRLLSALAAASVKSDKPAQTKRIINSRKQVNQAIDSLSVNVSPRLISLHLSQTLSI